MQLTDLIQAAMPTARRLSKEWELALGDPFPTATGSLVLEAGDYVLRIPVVMDEALSGFEAQIAFSGKGGVEVVKQDPDTLSTLLRRTRPGTMLAHAGLSISEEVWETCAVIRQLEVKAIPHEIPVERWYEPFLSVDSAEGIPDDILRLGQATARRLLSTIGRRRLVHGDLHHFNLLLDQGGWVAIDPQGVSSELEFEPAAFLRNPFETIHKTGNLPELLKTRVHTFAEALGVSAARVRDWGIAQNVLSAWWDPPGERTRTIKVVMALLDTP